MKTLVSWTAKSGYPISATTATRNYRANVLVLEFDDTTDEDIGFDAVMPRFFSGQPLTVKIGWMAADTTVTPHEVSWEVAFLSVTPDADDLDTKAFATYLYSTNNGEASVSGEIAEATTTHDTDGEIDSVLAGEWFRLTVRRNADGSGSQTDSLTGDAQLVYVKIEQE